MWRRWWKELAQWLPGNFTILLCVLPAVILIPPFFETEQGGRGASAIANPSATKGRGEESLGPRPLSCVAIRFGD